MEIVRVTPVEEVRVSSTGIRTRWAAIGAACAVALGGGGFGIVRAVVDSGDRSVYVPIEPTRVLDTRSGEPVSNRSLRLVVGGSIAVVDGPNREVVPSDATAVAINLTVTEGRKRDGYGYVTAYPCESESSTPPNASSINFENGIDIANGLNVTISTTQSICFYVWGTADLIVDILGYYGHHTHDDLYPRWEDMYSSLSTLEDQGNERPMPRSVVTARDDDRSAFDIDASVATTGRAAMVLRIEPSGGGNSQLAYFSCADFGCEDFDYFPLTSLGGDPIEPALEYQFDGNPVIVYYESAAPYGLRFVRCLDDRCTTSDPPLILTTGLDVGREPEVITTSFGQFLIAYRAGSSPNSELRFARVSCDTPGCIDVGPGNALPRGGYDPTLVVDPQGIPFVVHFTADGANSQMHVERCDNESCTSVTNKFSVNGPSSGDAILNADGFLILASVQNNQLTFRNCMMENCSVGVGLIASATTSITGVSDVTLALGSDGQPVGAYSDQSGSSRRLVYFKCSSRNCLSYISFDNWGLSWRTRVQEPIFEPRGSFADVVVASNGTTVILDQTDISPAGDEKIGITTCGNPYCLPYVRTP